MRVRYQILTAIVACAVLALGVNATFANTCVSGTVTAQFIDSGPFAGLYKYTAEISWTTTQGLSNITLDCGFGQCPEAACEQTYLFESPGGTGTGDGCTVEFDGEFNCQGNPSIGVTDPILKWDVVGDCEAENTGTATLCFFTNLGPHPDAPLPIFIAKNGQNVCSGTIQGDCPAAPCIVGTEKVNWGKLKGHYH